MTFEEFAAARLGALLRFAGVLTGDRALAEASRPSAPAAATRRTGAPPNPPPPRLQHRL